MTAVSYACFEGQKQGALSAGSKDNASHGNQRSDQWIEIESFELNPEPPEDADPVQLLGSRRRYPLVLTKEFGPASPQLQTAARDGEIFNTIIIETVGVDRHGFDYVEQRITVTDALIADVRAHTGKAAVLGRVFSDFSFTFQTIVIEQW